MPIVVREVDAASALETVCAIYTANRERPGSSTRFPWLYLDNPDGRATVWLAQDEASGEPAGFTVAHPRRMRVAGRPDPVVAWNCGDFSIHKRFRTMGVAVKLRRAAKAAVDSGRVPFLYAHPNERMLAVHELAGHRQMGTMRRFVKVLCVGGGAAAAVSRTALRLAGRDLLVRRTHDAEWLAGALPADVDEIDRTAAADRGTSLVRDTTYLNWRFAASPLERVEFLVMRRQGQPTGYLAVVVSEGAAFVRDWLAVDGAAFDQLWTALVDEMRRRRLSRVSVRMLDTHPDLARLRRFGFVEREGTATAVVTYAAPGGGFEAVLDARCWYMTDGDRDV